VLSKPIVHPGEAWKSRIQKSDLRARREWELIVDVLARVYFRACAVSLTREAGNVEILSLRLKNGFAQDDNAFEPRT